MERGNFPPGFHELDRFSLTQAILGRRSRRFFMGAEIPDGVLAYKSKHEPMPLDRMVSDTIGYTPVAIKFVINEATIHAHFDGRLAINYWDFTHAREGHDWGLKQPIRGKLLSSNRAVFLARFVDTSGDGGVALATGLQQTGRGTENAADQQQQAKGKLRRGGRRLRRSRLI